MHFWGQKYDFFLIFLENCTACLGNMLVYTFVRLYPSDMVYILVYRCFWFEVDSLDVTILTSNLASLACQVLSPNSRELDLVG